MERDQENIKVGSTTLQGSLSEITHSTDDGREVRLTGFIKDPEDPESMLATRYVHNLETGEITAEHGRVHGVVREATHYVWEHKKPILEVASLAVSVTLGTLWVRHKRTGKEK